MAEFKTAAEFLSFERKWKLVFTVFALVFAGALLDHMLRAPSGEEAAWCYTSGALAFLICCWAAHRLRDAARHESLIGGLELLAEDLSVTDLHE